MLPMSETRAAHATLRLSLAVYALTALAGAWEVVASQAPGSMFYVGVLPGPAQSLRESAFMLATVLFVASQLMPVAYREAAPRWLVIALHVSALCVLASGIYGACTGLHGEQLGERARTAGDPEHGARRAVVTAADHAVGARSAAGVDVRDHPLAHPRRIVRGDHLADELVAGHALEGHVAARELQIGVAHAADPHAHQRFAALTHRRRMVLRDVRDLQ